MAIARDTTADGFDWTTSTNPTWSHTCTGSDLVLFVYIFAGGASDIISSVTYAGTPMVRVAWENNDAQPGSGNQHYLYALFGPATGTNTVSVSKTSAKASGISFSYTGADSATGIVDVVTDPGVNSTSYTTTAVTPSTTDDWIIQALRDVDHFVASNDVTSNYVTYTGVIRMEAWDTNGSVGTTSPTTTTFTITPSGRLHGVISAVITPAGAGAVANNSARRQFLMMM